MPQRNALAVRKMGKNKLQDRVLSLDTSLTRSRGKVRKLELARSGDTWLQAGATVSGAGIAGAVEGIVELINQENGAVIGKTTTGVVGVILGVTGGIVSAKNPKTGSAVAGLGAGMLASAANEAGKNFAAKMLGKMFGFGGEAAS